MKSRPIVSIIIQVVVLFVISLTAYVSPVMAAIKKPLKVALLLAPSGKGDKSYNDMALKGLKEAKDKGEIKVIDMLPANTAEYNNVLNRFAQDGYDLIIGVGFLYADPINNVAGKYPKSKFLLIDGLVSNHNNVRSITFNPEEGSFLVGVAAGLTSKSKEIGFIAGMDIPIMKKFECGFNEGVKYASGIRKKPLTVTNKYIGSTPDSFSNPAKGRDMALLMYKSGINIIYHAAALSGNGIIQAAKETNNLVIGVDTDQSILGPKNVLSSMRKRIDLSVSRAIADVKSGSFSGGEVVMNLRNGGVDYVISDLASKDVWREVENAKSKLLNDNIKACK
jgi:basic membrane protein A and related proteins